MEDNTRKRLSRMRRFLMELRRKMMFNVFLIPSLGSAKMAPSLRPRSNFDSHDSIDIHRAKLSTILLLRKNLCKKRDCAADTSRYHSEQVLLSYTISLGACWALRGSFMLISSANFESLINTSNSISKHENSSIESLWKLKIYSNPSRQISAFYAFARWIFPTVKVMNEIPE